VHERQAGMAGVTLLEPTASHVQRAAPGRDGSSLSTRHGHADHKAQCRPLAYEGLEWAIAGSQ
jgi:hypothetical protein